MKFNINHAGGGLQGARLHAARAEACNCARYSNITCGGSSLTE